MILEFSTGFETETKVDSNQLSWALSHWMDHSTYGSFGIEGRDKNTPGAPTPHSGLHSILFEVLATPDGTKRSELDLNDVEGLVSNELFVSDWLYFPSDWALTNGGWWELADPYMTQNDPTSHYWPYLALQIFRNPNYQLVLRRLAENGAASYPAAGVPWTPIVGQWFKLSYYVLRHATNGNVKVWINDILQFDVSGFPTKHSSFAGWMTNPAKMYYNPDDNMLHRMWLDDLKISNSFGGENMVQTDANGNYTLPNLVRGNYTVQFVKDPYDTITASQTVTAGQTATLNETLVFKKGTITGKVTDEDGANVAGCEVTATKT